MPGHSTTCARHSSATCCSLSISHRLRGLNRTRLHREHIAAGAFATRPDKGRVQCSLASGRAPRSVRNHSLVALCSCKILMNGLFQHVIKMLIRMWFTTRTHGSMDHVTKKFTMAFYPSLFANVHLPTDFPPGLSSLRFLSHSRRTHQFLQQSPPRSATLAAMPGRFRGRLHLAKIALWSLVATSTMCEIWRLHK